MGKAVPDIQSSGNVLATAFEREIRRLRFADRDLERAFGEDYARRRIPQFRLVFWVGLVIQIPLSLRTVAVDDVGLSSPRFWIRLAVGVVPAVAGLMLIRSPRLVRWAAAYMVFYVLLIGATLVVILIGPDRVGWGRLMAYLTAACIMSRLRAREVALVELLLIGWYAFFTVAVLGKPVEVLASGLSNLGALAVFILVAAYLIESSARRDFLLLRLLGQERETSERLLLNILPASIAERLKGSSATVADSFEDVTVLFADIADSTPNVARLSAEEAVDFLNEIFTAFDGLADKHRLEKIKTIGDGYMVVGGLPEPRADHAQAVVALAVDMQEEIARFRWPTGEPVVLRIGINTGPVVAGVIGTSKFSYDLWGDTVHVASRMESHGVPGAVQLTGSTYKRVRGRYRCKRRRVNVKGKGEMPVYLIEATGPRVSKRKARSKA